MAKRAMARVVSVLGLFLGLAGLLVLIPSLAISGTFVSGLDYPTGLAIHPNERSLYVKSGITGRVWKIPIATDGTAGGSPVVMTDAFSLYHDIDFDASGNLYGAVVNDDAIVRLTPGGVIETADLFESAVSIAIEPPGLPTNKLYFVDEDVELSSFPIASFLEYRPDLGEFDANTCGQFRFLHHRLALIELLATYADKLVSVSPSSGSCTTLLSGLIQPNGIAEDPDGNIYVADTLAGTVTQITALGQVEVIAEGLASPTGLVFDSETGLLFVSETDADRITTIGGTVIVDGAFIRPMEDWDLNGYQFGDDWPFNKCKKLLYKHAGVDMNVGATTVGKAVRASASGVVKEVCFNPVWKYALVLEHDMDGNLDTADDRVTTVYWHIYPVLPIELPTEKGCFPANPEVSVEQGEQIAIVANMGSLSHLHFGLRWAPYELNLSDKGALPPEECPPEKRKGLPAFPEAFVDPLDYLE